MKTLTKMLLFLFTLAQFAYAEDAALRDPVAAILKDLSAKDQQKLEDGEVVFVSSSEKDADGAQVGIGWAIGVINAKPEAVWPVLDNFADYPEYMPRVDSVERYEIKGDAEHFGLTYTLGILFTKQIYHIKQRNDKAAMEITWQKDPDKTDDFTKNDGHWILRAHGEGKTLALYSIDVRIKSIIPKGVQNFLMKRDLPDVVDALKQRVESGGKYSK